MKSELSPAERVMLRLDIVEAGLSELRGKQNRLELQWGEFTSIVSQQIAKRIIAPWLQSQIHVPDDLLIENRKDPLSLEDLESILKKRGEG